MASFKSTVITAKGHALMAKIVAGTATPTFTQVKVSNTDYSAYTQSQLEALTSITNVKQSMQVAEVEKVNAASVKVSAALDNTALATGYYLKTIGLYAQDPVEGEILYSVTPAIESDWIPPNTGISVTSIMIDLITVVSNADNVSVAVDPNATATVAQINEIWDEIEKPEFNSVQLTTLEQIKSVIDSYGGLAEFIVSGVTLSNACNNGNFESGAITFANITANTANALDSTFKTDGTYSMKVTSSLAGVRYVGKMFKFKAGDKIFIKVKMKSDGVAAALAVFDGSEVGGSSYLGTEFVTRYRIRTIASDNPYLYLYATTNPGSTWYDEVTVVKMNGTPFENLTEAEMNAITNKYVEGSQGANGFTVGSRERNLVNFEDIIFGKLLFGGGLAGTTFTITNDSTRAYLIVKVKPNTTYRISSANVGRATVREIQRDLIAAGVDYSISTGGVITTGANTNYLGINFGNSSVAGSGTYDVVKSNNWMLNEGSTALPYEPYQGSKVTVNATRNKLPNLVEDLLQFKDGKFSFTKKTKEDYNNIMKGITGWTIGDDDGTNHAFRITAPTFFTDGAFNQSDLSVILQIGSDVYKTISVNDNTPYTVYITSSNLLRIKVPKATFPDVAAFNAYLQANNVKFIYQLAAPITIPEEDFGDYGITVTGALTSNTDFTEFFVEDYDLFSPITVNYSTNLAKATENMKEAMQGLREMNDFTVAMLLNHEMRITLLETP